MRQRRLAAAATCVSALAAAASIAGATANAASSSQSQAARLLGGTPVLSVRRVPDWLETTAASQRLVSALLAYSSSYLGSTARPSGCLTVSQGGGLLFAANPTAMLIPASNMKLLTATAVLDVLGSSDRLVTRVQASSPPDNGVVYGDLYLVGGGDPLLRTPGYDAGLNPPEPLFTSLDVLARQVRDAGIRRVTGSVVGDDTRYDSQRTVPTWKPVYSTEGDVGPLSALDVNDGFVPKPPPPSATTTTTVPGRRTPPTTVQPESSTAQAFAFAAASNPPLTAAEEFVSLLRSDGVEVSGGAASGVTPAGAPAVTSIDSGPLGAEVSAMLNVSDDTAAELFTKELGLKKDGSGTTAAGTAVIRADLAADGFPVSQMVNIDGSGLDRGDRASCELISDALLRAGTSGPIARGLPVAGKSGTLATRMIGTAAAGRVHAKTGTLDEVVSLSGFVTPLARSAPTPALQRTVVFSIIINGLPGPQAQQVADDLAVVLASYPHVPPISEVEPLP
jgi:serine-type D-Ala-D-Ala carboxypeptidase/endopeptidase (penicillin-binding protein 4)